MEELDAPAQPWPTAKVVSSKPPSWRDEPVHGATSPPVDPRLGVTRRDSHRAGVSTFSGNAQLEEGDGLHAPTASVETPRACPEPRQLNAKRRRNRPFPILGKSGLLLRLPRQVGPHELTLALVPGTRGLLVVSRGGTHALDERLELLHADIVWHEFRLAYPATD